MRATRATVPALLASLVLIAACQPNQVSQTTTTTGTPSATVVLASDDIVNTPAGPAYRGNVREQGVQNPFPPVQTIAVPLPGPEDLRLDYRETIETKAGQTRNNIMWLYGTSVSGKQGQTAVFTPESLPSGFEALPAQTTVSPVTKAVMEIRISSTVPAGKYSFQIRTQIGSQDYAEVPCAIDVTPQ